MRNCLKLGVFTLFTAFVLFLVCEQSYATPGFTEKDEHGRLVNVINPDKYLKANPYKPPAKKPAPRPVIKKPVPKPKPKPPAPKPPAPKIDRATIDQIKREVRAEMKREEEAKHPSFREANKEAIKGCAVGAVTGAVLTPEFGGTGAVPGAGIGILGGYVSYFMEHVVGKE